jgi:hypothetical protein
MAVPEFLAGTTLLKGAAYKSEREVRIDFLLITDAPGYNRSRRDRSCQPDSGCRPTRSTIVAPRDVHAPNH